MLSESKNSVLHLYFCRIPSFWFQVSALWCPLATPTVLLGFLLPWMWGISSRLLQQKAATAPYLGRGVSPHHCPSWPWTWNSSSRPSCARAATAPWRWGCSSRPPPGLGQPLSAPLWCRRSRPRNAMWCGHFKTFKTVWQFLKRLSIELHSDPAIPLLGIYPGEIKSLPPHKNLYRNVQSSIIHNVHQQMIR